MALRKLSLLSTVALLLSAFGGGCGATPAPTTPYEVPLVYPSAVPTTLEAPTKPTAAPEVAPTAGPAPTAEAPKPRPSGPAMLMSDAEEVTGTFAARPPTKLVVGDAQKVTLRIPEGALGQPTNIALRIAKKVKVGGFLIGRVFHLVPLVPPATTPSRIASLADPFELTVMAAPNHISANLALGSVAYDAYGRETLTWRIVAPTKVDAGAGLLSFELGALIPAYFHLTSLPPTK